TLVPLSRRRRPWLPPGGDDDETPPLGPIRRVGIGDRRGLRSGAAAETTSPDSRPCVPPALSTAAFSHPESPVGYATPRTAQPLRRGGGLGGNGAPRSRRPGPPPSSPGPHPDATRWQRTPAGNRPPS